MGSTHRFAEIDIRMKFNENRSKDLVDMEQTRNSSVNPIALNCDLDIEFL